MGVVYEAEDPVIGRKVAIKCLKLDADDNSEFRLARFLREPHSAIDGQLRFAVE